MACQISPLLFSLWIISASADVFMSIDCGSSDIVYTDENSIVWVGDIGYIQNGESRVVQTANSISKVMNTLRVFTTRNKNCYSINADPNGRVLLRVSFYYGNYDNLLSPPSFDLQFDGNDWTTVETSLDEVVTYEVTYVVKGEYLSVCVAQTKPNEFPFISAIEVRSLDATMYNQVEDDHALLLGGRITYGTNQTIRYIDDVYDRIWNPSSGGNGIISVSNDATLIDNDGGDKPPTAVLQNAITVSNDTNEITLFTLQPSVFPLYINMYFSEVIDLQSTHNRSFRVFTGNESFSDPISPPYGNYTEFYATNVNISSNTTFSLVATSGSTLPPLINALEVFIITDKLTPGTNSNDLDGLGALQTGYPLLQEWSGDPCLPAPFSWEWINCSSDAIPRVIALRLSSYGLEGLLADFSSMDSLEIIDLQNNSFIGPIPDFLGMFPKLTQLNLEDNNFSGAVPESLLNKNGLTLLVTGNPDLCTPGKPCDTITTSTTGSTVVRQKKKSKPCDTITTSTTGSTVVRQKKKSGKLPVILGVTIPLFLLVWVIAGVFAILNHRSKANAALINANKGQVGTSSPSPLLVNPQMMDAFDQVLNNNNNYQSVEMNGQSAPGLDNQTTQTQ